MCFVGCMISFFCVSLCKFFFDFTKISFVYRNFVPIVQANFFQQERVFSLSLGSLGQFDICYVLQN